MIEIICPCGKKFSIFPSVIKAGKGKFCSKKCAYENFVRRSGLKYNIKVKNPTWFKKGFIPWNKGTIGMQIAWNKGIKGTHFSPKTEFKKGQTLGKKNYKWKGDNVGYFALHAWVNRNFKKPKKCQKCNSIKFLEWANLNQVYNRERKNWIYLCRKCHKKLDKKTPDFCKCGNIHYSKGFCKKCYRRKYFLLKGK